MMPSRRSFLFGALAAPVIVRASSLMAVSAWVEPELPALVPVFGDGLLTPSMITKEMLVILENNLIAAGKINRMFERQYSKIGAAILVRKPMWPRIAA